MIRHDRRSPEDFSSTLWHETQVSREIPTRPKDLVAGEWITLGLFRYGVTMDDVKVYQRYFLSHDSQDFKSLPNYQNFNAPLNRATPYVIFLVQWLCHLQNQTAVAPYRIDSTALSVCKNMRIASHKVCKGFAEKGKTTTGWFYGFKLQTVCDSLARLISVLIVPGNKDDRKFIFKLFRGLNRRCKHRINLISRFT